MSTVHLHYTPGNNDSERYAHESKLSFEKYGWDVKPVEGYTPDTAPIHSLMIYPEGRTQYVMRHRPRVARTKLAVLCNHLRFWTGVYDTGLPQIYAEHECICTQPVFDLPDFKDVLALHIDKNNLEHIDKNCDNGRRNIFHIDYSKDPGVHEYPWKHKKLIRYTYPNFMDEGYLLPGAGCYALTPRGAEKLLNFVDEYGAEQGDMLMNSKVVSMSYHVPAIVHLRDQCSYSLGIPEPGERVL